MQLSEMFKTATAIFPSRSDVSHNIKLAKFCKLFINSQILFSITHFIKLTNIIYLLTTCSLYLIINKIIINIYQMEFNDYRVMFISSTPYLTFSSCIVLKMQVHNLITSNGIILMKISLI